MANRLYETLDKAAFNYTDSEMEADLIEIENITDEDIPTEKSTKIDFSEIGNTVSQGMKSAGAGLSNFFSKKNKATEADDNFEKVKKLKELLDMGAITQEEFDVKKKELLSL